MSKDPAPDRRDVLQGAAVTAVSGAVGFVAFRRLGPAPGTPSAYPQAVGSDAVLAAVSDIPSGGGVVLPDSKLVLTRSGDTIACFTAVCPHQGCLVSQVRDGQIECPCHGSVFDAATGAVVHGPATRALDVVAVSISGGEVVRG